MTGIALDRLHLLKKDASQLGQNARKTVKFLDHITSTANLPHDPVILQGPDDQYATWQEVEGRYVDAVIQRNDENDTAIAEEKSEVQDGNIPTRSQELTPEKLMNDLSLTSEDFKTSPISTPPLSPSASEPQSAKTSPEVRCATVTKYDATPVPPALKPLVNFVVWYTYESKDSTRDATLTFLTNSADAAQIAKDFGVTPKTIHQLRATITSELEGSKRQDHIQQKKGSFRSLKAKNDSEPRTLFRYDEGSSEEEELVFKPRTRDPPRPSSSGRGVANSAYRGRGAVHSPSNSMSTTSVPKPQVPVEEIDPDSFDRGTFARGNTPLANVGNHAAFTHTNNNNNFSRGGQRGSYNQSSQRGGSYRGNNFRGRGRGRLFVP